MKDKEKVKRNYFHTCTIISTVQRESGWANFAKLRGYQVQKHLSKLISKWYHRLWKDWQ